jgi:hypothetical protein
MVETSWKDSAKAKLDSLVEQAGKDHRDELVTLLRSSLHTLNARTPYEGGRPRKIVRLLDDPAPVTGRSLYRCEGCGEEDRGNDRDRRHMQWRERHWANCWPE